MKNTHTKALMYAGTLFLLVLSVLVVAGTIFVINGNKSYAENTISVTGEAEVSSAPDVANFSFSVEETAKDPKEGQKVISKKVSKILKGLKDLSVVDKDIRTESYTIYPKYEWVKLTDTTKKQALSGEYYLPNDSSKRVQVGFDVRQNVRVKMRDLKKVPEILTLFAENGVEDLNGPNFEIDDPEALKEEVRLKAIKDAKQKAKRLASDLGVKLGKITSFSDSGHTSAPYFAKNMMARSDMMATGANSYSPELPKGEKEIVSRVTITYKIR